ncbi:ribonuclease J [Candidatus Roizmanbacteria bacterium]|nr:ribonuclease J [Candidatus Roizmanbacteria bacterium]
MNAYRLRFVPLGGVVGVTKNMYVYELYDGNSLKDILIVDCGFGFPQERELGVDLVIPDISYLLDKTDKIRAILLSHGHEDHTSALPYHYDALGRPPVFSSKLTSLFVENKFQDFKKQIKVNTVEYRKDYSFGGFSVRFINMTHSIPDTMHLIISTPVGRIYHGTDFKMDLTPPYGSSPDFYEMTKAGNDGVLCLMSDCLGAEREGLTLSESVVGQTFEDEMRKTKGKFIMSTFSSNISRIRQCVEAAIKFNRQIVFLGRSMRDNTKLASENGYLPIPFRLVAKEEEVMKLPANKVCLIVAGSQGQYNSALSKLANKQNKNIRIQIGDKIILSSDPIPGNATEVYALIEELTLQGADVVYSDIQEELHASGHGNQEDIKFLIRFTNPRYFIPIGGTIRHQRSYQKLAVDMGYKKESLFLLDEGETVWFTAGKAVRGDTVETKNIYVDAYGVGDVGNVVLRDRKTLSSDGIVMAFLILDPQGKLLARPIILSRGFVFEKKEEELFNKAQQFVEKVLKPRGESVSNMGALKKQVGQQLEDFFFRERGREPLVVVETIEL